MTKRGFSLMEMMTVMLIVSIIAAASAPMINRKMLTEANKNSPWVVTGLDNSIAYNLSNSDSMTAVIGDMKAPNGVKPSLHISGTVGNPHITLGNSNPINVRYDSGSNILGISTITPAAANTTAIGHSANASALNATAFGQGAQATSSNTTAIGQGATASAWNTTAIGQGATANIEDAIALGKSANASGNYAIAIGVQAKATAINTTVLGRGASANTVGATALGRSAKANAISAIALGISANASANNATALGHDAIASSESAIALGKGNASAENAIALGRSANALKGNSLAIGLNSSANSIHSVAIGPGSQADASMEDKKFAETETPRSATAVGHDAKATRHCSTAYGSAAGAHGFASTAIGHNAQAGNANSVAIGPGASTKTNNQIVLGTADSTVYIPGNLVVDYTTFLGAAKNSDKSYVAMYLSYDSDDEPPHGTTDSGLRYIKRGDDTQNDGAVRFGKTLEPSYSDRRLKNVGEAFKAGLEEIKKLEVFHYTFKKDPNATPRVGVMAQDLQKIFPDAVFKGEDGFLRIRMEDMFYATVNAIKELDLKLTELVAQVKTAVADITDLKIKSAEYEKTIAEQNKTIEAQNKKIEAQDKALKALEKRLARLEKKTKKADILDSEE